jgi:hypothetical protein
MFSSWAFDRAPLELLTNKLTYMPDNHRLLGHACYDEDLDLFLYYSGVAHIFIYRDLRDVAVSQAYHILNDDDERFRHPGKELYRSKGNFEDVLSAVWNGIEGYPGVALRWRYYEGWKQSPHTLTLDYDDVVYDLRAASIAILEHGKVGGPVTIDAMIASAKDTGKSPTFRRGVPGEWRKYSGVFEGDETLA